MTQIAKVFGAKEQNIALEDGALVRNLIVFLSDKHGDALLVHLLKSRDPLELIPHVSIQVNGRNIRFLNGLDTVLRDGDDVFFMPLLGGVVKHF